MSKIKSLDILFIFFIFIVLCLGTWQIIRLYSKNILIINLENNLKKSSVSFNESINKEYIKVSLNKKNLDSKLFLYHLHKGEIGFKVIIPYEVNNSQVVLVDKGWVKKDKINLLKKTLFSNEVVEGYTKKFKKKIYLHQIIILKKIFYIRLRLLVCKNL